MTKHNSESGRTMLEMLGVLAIMGVIMYGAIAGIGFGVNMYKINATFNEAEELCQGIIDLYSWRQGYPEASNIVTAVVNNDVLSGAKAVGAASIDAPFGEFTIAPMQEDSPEHYSRFAVIINGLPQIACSRLQVMSFANMEVVQQGDPSFDAVGCTTNCDSDPGYVCLVLR